MKTINVIEYPQLPKLSWKDIKENFESNGLKQKKDRDIGGLKEAIIAKGFLVPLFVWIEGKYIVDGSGRLMALAMLEYEGYEIPDLHYLPIKATTRKEAKEFTLAVSSKFGKVTDESFADFLGDIPDIDITFYNIEGVEMEDIDIKIKPLLDEEKKPKSTTIFKHKCPKCGFES